MRRDHFLRDVAQWLRRQFWELEICEFESRHPDILNVARGVIEALEIVTLSVRGQNPSGQIFWAKHENEPRPIDKGCLVLRRRG